jgi:hypothetical protein
VNGLAAAAGVCLPGWLKLQRNQVRYSACPVNFMKRYRYDTAEVFPDCFQCCHYQFPNLPDGRRRPATHGENQKADDTGGGYVVIACSLGNILQIFRGHAAVLYCLSCGDLLILISDEATFDQMISMASP